MIIQILKRILPVFPIVSFLFLFSCATKSLEDFREEGESVTKSLIQEMEEIKNKKDLVKAKSKLQRLFIRLVDIIIEAEMLQEASSDEIIELTPENHELSDRLRSELNRLYEIPGGYEIIEKCQEEALQRLDTFKKAKLKKKK